MESGSLNPDPLIGTTIGGKYHIIEKLGAGGMGGVYKAEHLLMNRIVAVKVLRSNLVHDEVLLKRFHHEAKAASQISHPNAVILFDYGVENSLPYLVMEFIEGSTLKTLIAEEKPLSIARVSDILRQICSALDQAHRAGIVHRDIKPDNFMVRKGENGEDIVKVLDFGVSKSIGMGDLASKDSNLTQAGTIIGTPQYISPEQCQGKELDVRCDIYSLGVVTYEMLCGEAPFTAPTVLELLVKVLHHQAQPIRKFKPELNIPPAIDAAVMKAIEKDRDKRYSRILDFYHDFAKAAGLDDRPVIEAPRTPKLILALCAMIVVVLGILLLRPSGPGARPGDDRKLQQLTDAVKRAEKEKADALARVEWLKKEADELLQKNDTEKAKEIQAQQVAAEKAEQEMDASLKKAMGDKEQMEALLSKMKQSNAEKEEALRREQEAAKRAEEEKAAALKKMQDAQAEADRKAAEMEKAQKESEAATLKREQELAAQAEKDKQEALRAQQQAAAKAEQEKQEALKEVEAAKAESARLAEMAKQMKAEKEAVLKQMEAAKKQQASASGDKTQAGKTAPPADTKTVEAAKIAAAKAKEDELKLNDAIRKANQQKEEAIKRAEQMKLEAARQAAAAQQAEEQARKMKEEAEKKMQQQSSAPPEAPADGEVPAKRRRCGPNWCL